MKLIFIYFPVSEKSSAVSVAKSSTLADLGNVQDDKVFGGSLSLTGLLPVTHKVACGLISDDGATDLINRFSTSPLITIFIADGILTPGFGHNMLKDIDLKGVSLFNKVV